VAYVKYCFGMCVEGLQETAAGVWQGSRCVQGPERCPSCSMNRYYVTLQVRDRKQFFKSTEGHCSHSHVSRDPVVAGRAGP
jgi:hypothetical protein